jgi:hypothetical protein
MKKSLIIMLLLTALTFELCAVDQQYHSENYKSKSLHNVSLARINTSTDVDVIAQEHSIVVIHDDSSSEPDEDDYMEEPLYDNVEFTEDYQQQFSNQQASDVDQSTNKLVNDIIYCPKPVYMLCAPSTSGSPCFSYYYYYGNSDNSSADDCNNPPPASTIIVGLLQSPIPQ